MEVITKHIDELKTITIPLEEYKELLIIKGKYEELKLKESTPVHIPSLTDPFTPRYPYEITCDKESGNHIPSLE